MQGSIGSSVSAPKNKYNDMYWLNLAIPPCTASGTQIFKPWWTVLLFKTSRRKFSCFIFGSNKITTYIILEKDCVHTGLDLCKFWTPHRCTEKCTISSQSTVNPDIPEEARAVGRQRNFEVLVRPKCATQAHSETHFLPKTTDGWIYEVDNSGPSTS